MAGIKKGTKLGAWSDARKAKWLEARWPGKIVPDPALVQEARAALNAENTPLEDVKEMLVETKTEEVKGE